jgi:hypothetical protein
MGIEAMTLAEWVLVGVLVIAATTVILTLLSDY